jgi:hypothetical protein
MSELIFETPTADGKKGRWADRMAQMAEHPGEWVNITKSFGLSPKSGGAVVDCARRAADKLGVRIEIVNQTMNPDVRAVFGRVLKEEP